jgi:hypothetical protein
MTMTDIQQPTASPAQAEPELVEPDTTERMRTAEPASTALDSAAPALPPAPSTPPQPAAKKPLGNLFAALVGAGAGAALTIGAFFAIGVYTTVTNVLNTVVASSATANSQVVPDGNGGFLVRP